MTGNLTFFKDEIFFLLKSTIFTLGVAETFIDYHVRKLS